MAPSSDNNRNQSHTHTINNAQQTNSHFALTRFWFCFPSSTPIQPQLFLCTFTFTPQRNSKHWGGLDCIACAEIFACFSQIRHSTCKYLGGKRRWNEIGTLVSPVQSFSSFSFYFGLDWSEVKFGVIFRLLLWKAKLNRYSYLGKESKGNYSREWNETLALFKLSG